MSRLFTYLETRSILPPRSIVPPNPLANRGGLAGAIVEPPTEPTTTEPTKEGKEGKGNLELLLKMIPGEVVSLYTFAINLVPLVSIQAARSGIAWGLFGLGIALTPWFLSLQEPKPKDPGWRRAWWWRRGLATGAFPVWAYATSGDKVPGMPYDTIMGLIIVGVYSAVAGGIAKSVAPKPPPTA